MGRGQLSSNVKFPNESTAMKPGASEYMVSSVLMLIQPAAAIEGAVAPLEKLRCARRGWVLIFNRLRVLSASVSVSI